MKNMLVKLIVDKNATLMKWQVGKVANGCIDKIMKQQIGKIVC
jgi:hypothetical protein